MVTNHSLRTALSLLILILFFQEIAAIHDLQNISEGLSKDINTSVNSTVNLTTGSTNTAAPTGIIDPCQHSKSWGQRRANKDNVFDQEKFERRYVICNDESNTPCTPDSFCCECKLVCKNGVNCTASATFLTDAPTISPALKSDPGSETNNIDPNSISDDQLPEDPFPSTGVDLISSLVSLVIILSCCINIVIVFHKLRKRGLEYSLEPIPVDTVTTPSVGGKADPIYLAKVKRHEEIICKFHFRTLLGRGDGDGGSARSLRSSRSFGTNEGSVNSDPECPCSPETNLDQFLPAKERRRPSMSFWRRQARKDECCICLENYGLGDTICTPITKECNHMFHEECAVAWLQHHDQCPLCRVDLLKEAMVVDSQPTPPTRASTALASEPQTRSPSS